MKTILEYLNNNDEIIEESADVSGIALKDLNKGDHIYYADINPSETKSWDDVKITKDTVKSVTLGEDDDENEYYIVGGLIIKTEKYPKGISWPLYIQAKAANEVAYFNRVNYHVIATDVDAMKMVAKRAWKENADSEARIDALLAKIKKVEQTDADKYKAEYDALEDKYGNENGKEINAKLDKEFNEKVKALKAKYNIK